MKYALKDLLDIPTLCELLDSLDEVHGMPSAIVDREGTILTATAWQDICTKFHRVNPETEKKCIESDTHIKVELDKNMSHVIYRCPLGLVDAAIPIIIEGEYLGSVFIGQLFIEPPDEAYFIEQARQYGFDETEYLTAMRKVPCYTEEQLHKNLTFMHQLAQMLAKQGLQAIRQRETLETLQKSEERLRSYVELSPHGVFITDEKGHYTDVNPAASVITGYSTHELLEMSIPEMLPPEALHWGANNFKQLVETGRSSGETAFLRKNGKTGYWSLEAVKLSATSFMGMVTDITKRKQTEDLLQKNEHYLKLIIETLPIALAMNDSAGNITFLNRTFTQTIGYTIDEIPTLEEWWPRAYPDESYRQMIADHWNKRLDETKRTNRPFSPLEAKIVCKDGSIRDFLCVASVLEESFNETHMVFLYDITEQKLAEIDLKHSHQLMSYIIQHNQSALAVHDKNMRYIYVSQRYLDDYNVKEKNIIGKHHYEVFPDLPQKWRDVHRKALSGIISSSEEDSYEREDGTIVWTRWECRPWFESNGSIGGIIIYTEVITERKRAEEQRSMLKEQLMQAQKMESIGRLAGSVAHDFNNLLTVILGGTYLALMELSPGQPLHDYVTSIQKAAEKSADLTQQLLAFARKQTIMPIVLDLNKTIENMIKMLQRLIGEDIELKWQPKENLWSVKADPSQIDQILANLCVNARDSISDIGKITIQTGNHIVDECNITDQADVIPGEYVYISICDNGCGMDKDTVTRIFEPFFTTKGERKGTGLGLATVYGVVRQNNGFINVYSEPGLGTTFTIYLPRYASNADHFFAQEDTVPPAPRGLETILLVEDEPSILNMTATILTKQGYNVLEANTPAEAIRLADEHSERIDLLITDVIMPEMNGKDLANRLTTLYPEFKCLYMSGYTADIISHHGVFDEDTNFIQKPFSLPDLSNKVRAVLNV